MELYTSLTRLKMAMNGQQAPITPLTPQASALLDSPGMGMIAARPSGRLRCPVRGCHRTAENLATHLTVAHREIGGAAGVRALLDIPPNTPLVSDRLRADLIERGRSQATLRAVRPPPMSKRDAKRVQRLGARYSKMVGVHNLYDRCEAQLSHKLIELARTIGRSPSRSDAAATLGYNFVSNVVRVFGSWNVAKAAVGLDTYLAGADEKLLVSLDEVLTCLAAYYERRGDLPVARAAMRTGGLMPVPFIHSYKTILRVTNSKTWGEAMERVAAALNIRGGRYGLPEPAGAAAAG